MKWFQFNNPAFKVKVLDYTYTSEPSINTALPLQTSRLKLLLFYFAVVVSLGFVWLLSKWSARRKAILRCNICQLEEATHFLIRDEDNGGASTLVQRKDKFEMRLKRRCVSFNYHDRNYIYVEEKEVFVPIRYEELGLHLDQLKKDRFLPLSEARREQLLEYYGENVMRLQVQSRLQIFIQQMLTPYEVFQTYGIILWIMEEYYIFAFILLAYSVYTYWQNASDMQSNQQKLAYESYFDVQTKVLVDQTPHHLHDEEDGVQEIQMCTPQNNLDEHKSEIMKKDFNGIQNGENTEKNHEQGDVEKVLQERRVVMRKTREVGNEENNLINNRNIRFQTISSHRLVPGDIIILNELDRVPCDCILLRGEALVNEKYSTGENYLVRKEQIENFTYQKENQKSFLLYLGSEITKIKNIQYRIKRKTAPLGSKHHTQGEKCRDNELESIESSMQQDKIDAVNEIVCLVTHTNFSTLRGKYLRAIRYQNKFEDQFFRQTIYFIYLIILLTSLVYFAYLGRLGPYTAELDMFRIFMDLLITAIPPTLPTVLNLGIDFVTRRLKAHGINSVMPKFILTGGKIDTVVLKGDEVFGKEYEVHSAAIGTKGHRGFGLTFSSVNEFEAYHDGEGSFVVGGVRRGRDQMREFYRIGAFFVDALACCHTLEFFQKQIHGSVFEKRAFQFSQAVNTNEDCFETLNHQLQVRKIIRFKAKIMKLAVLARLRQRPTIKLVREEQVLPFIELKQRECESITGKGKKCSIQVQVREAQMARKQQWQNYIFLKGSAEKVLQNCARNTYPQNAFDYIVDMAEKGFMLFAYAVLELPEEWLLTEGLDFQNLVGRSEFTFLGFVVLQQAQTQENLGAVRDLKAADVKVVFVSEQHELQAASKAMFNGVCKKNELLLCSLNHQQNGVVCKGHIEWQSSSPDIYPEFITEFEEFGRASKVSLTAPLYEELFMKRELPAAGGLFEKAIIFSKMEVKHEKSLFGQLERRGKVCCAVGRSGSLYESASLSLELEREQSALLSSFHTLSTSLESVVTCLRICRAGLSTNFHGFSMMILFSLIQFTTLALLNLNYQTLSNDQSLYEDLFITFPIFVTINLTQPANTLSKELPPSSFFSLRHVVSMCGQLIIQLIVQLCFYIYVLSLDSFSQEREAAKAYYIQNGTFEVGSSLSLALFVLSNNIYLGIVLSTSVSKPFRKPFYTNPFYTINLILLWCYNTCLVIFPGLSPSEMRQKNLSDQSQFVLVVALLVGNLTMVLMYLYENLLVFLWSKENPCLKRRQLQQQQEYQMEDMVK